MFLSCRSSTSISKTEKQIEKEKKRRAKDDIVLYKKALKKHMKTQTRYTRKEMKRNYKEAMRYMEQKPEPILRRLFRDRGRQKRQKG